MKIFKLTKLEWCILITFIIAIVMAVVVSDTKL